MVPIRGHPRLGGIRVGNQPRGGRETASNGRAMEGAAEAEDQRGWMIKDKP